jgi:hypothetical protein
MEGNDTFVREEALAAQEGNASRPNVNDHTTFLFNARDFRPRSHILGSRSKRPQIEEHE